MTDRVGKFWPYSSETEMWEHGEREQQQKRQAEVQAEIQRDVIEGTWTG